jgi:hypothetical protein
MGDATGPPRQQGDAGTNGAHRFDHVVSVMFENRSFDNLLGYLYDPGEVASFEGVAGRGLSNPIPSYAPDAERGVVPVHVATSMDAPNPDAGEEHPHTNTQLFGTVAPEDNRFLSCEAMQPPFNAPDDPGREPTMDGFVLDYVNTFRSEMDRLPGYDEYAQIMACYTPEQVPVISTVAKGFATFDHWFCEVPSQTFTNRSFDHAASASGLVVNPPMTASRARTTPRPSSSGSMPPDSPGGCTSTPACRSRSRDDPHATAVQAVRHPLLHPRRLLRRRRAGQAAHLLLHRAQPAARPQRLPPRLQRHHPRLRG